MHFVWLLLEGKYPFSDMQIIVIESKIRMEMLQKFFTDDIFNKIIENNVWGQDEGQADIISE